VSCAAGRAAEYLRHGPEQHNVVHVLAAKRNDTPRRPAVAARAYPAATAARPQDLQSGREREKVLTAR
jgi:hypothetical protein